MTNTDTADAEATARQVAELARAGSELVRITVNSPEAAAQVAGIRDELRCAGRAGAADRRFPFQRPPLADPVSGLRRRRSTSTASTRATSGAARSATSSSRTMIEIACRYDKPVRIGVNWGSLDQELLARMMDDNARRPQPWTPAR